MGKRTKIIEWLYEKIEINKDLLKSLLPVLPIVFLLAFFILTVIFKFPTIDGFIYLIDIFLKSGNYILDSGNFILFSIYGVIIIFIFLLVTIGIFENQPNEKTKKFSTSFFTIFLGINSFLFIVIPTIHNYLLIGKIPFSIILLIEIGLEIAALIYFYKDIKSIVVLHLKGKILPSVEP